MYPIRYHGLKNIYIENYVITIQIDRPDDQIIYNITDVRWNY